MLKSQNECGTRKELQKYKGAYFKPVEGMDKDE